MNPSLAKQVTPVATAQQDRPPSYRKSWAQNNKNGKPKGIDNNEIERHFEGKTKKNFYGCGKKKNDNQQVQPLEDCQLPTYEMALRQLDVSKLRAENEVRISMESCSCKKYDGQATLSNSDSPECDSSLYTKAMDAGI